MPTIVATVKLKQGREEEAKATFKTLAEETLANEPGTLAYQLYVTRGDPSTIVVYERYESDEAFAIHSKNLGKKGAKLAELLDGPPQLLILEEL